MDLLRWAGNPAAHGATFPAPELHTESDVIGVANGRRDGEGGPAESRDGLAYQFVENVPFGVDRAGEIAR